MEMYRCTNCMQEIGKDDAFCPYCGFDMSKYVQPVNALRLNTILNGKYLIGKVLGQGGFGITYVAYDLILELRVAVKEYIPMNSAVRDHTHSNQLQWTFTTTEERSWADGIQRFLTEAKRMAKLDDIPGIVRVRDSFLENQTAYIVMDYAEGITLKQYLAQYGRMDVKTCLDLFLPLMDSLEIMHEKGMIHRDISVSNIMVRRTPKGLEARLLDFGAAVDTRAKEHSGLSEAVVARGYSAPEQYMENGNIGSWTDVYSLAAVIYNCLSETELPEAPRRLMSPTEFSVKGIKDKKVGEALRKALALKPEDRTRTMASLKTSFSRKAPIKKIIAAAAALAVLAIGGAVGAIALSRNSGAATAEIVEDSSSYKNIWSKYSYYIDTDNNLYINAYDSEGKTFYIGSENEQLVDENADCVTVGSEYAYFIQNSSDSSTENTIMRMDFDGKHLKKLLSGNSYNNLLYVKDSKGHEFLYYLKGNGDADDLLDTLCRYNLENRAEEELLSQDVHWYGINGKYIYYSTFPTNNPLENITLKRALLNGKKEETLDEENRLISGFVDKSGIYLSSLAQEKLVICDLDGKPREDIPGSGRSDQYLADCANNGFLYDDGWIYYFSDDADEILKVKPDGSEASVVFGGVHMVNASHESSSLLVYSGDESGEEEHAFFISDDGTGSPVVVGEYQNTDGLLYVVEDGKVILTGYIGDKDYVIVPWEFDEGTWEGTYRSGLFPSDIRIFIYPQTDGLTYEKTEDETGIVLTGCTGNINEKWEWIALPDEIDGLPVVELGEDLFMDNENIKSILLPNTLKTINDRAFYNCVNLEELELPEGLETIGVSALENTNLKKVVIPSTLETLYYSALCGIDEIEVAEGNTMYRMQEGVLYGDNNSTIEAVLPSKSGAFTVPSQVTHIASYAFDSSSLEEVTIPGSVDEIFSYTFYGATFLKKVIIEEGTREIKKGCFKKCTSLEEIVIPESVTAIGEEAFSDCPNLKSVTISQNCIVAEDAFGSRVEISYY